LLERQSALSSVHDSALAIHVTRRRPGFASNSVRQRQTGSSASKAVSPPSRPSRTSSGRVIVISSMRIAGTETSTAAARSMRVSAKARRGMAYLDGEPADAGAAAVTGGATTGGDGTLAAAGAGSAAAGAGGAGAVDA